MDEYKEPDTEENKRNEEFHLKQDDKHVSPPYEHIQLNVPTNQLMSQINSASQLQLETLAHTLTKDMLQSFNDSVYVYLAYLYAKYNEIDEEIMQRIIFCYNESTTLVRNSEIHCFWIEKLMQLNAIEPGKTAGNLIIMFHNSQYKAKSKIIDLILSILGLFPEMLLDINLEFLSILINSEQLKKLNSIIESIPYSQMKEEILRVLETSGFNDNIDERIDDEELSI